jgi:hypothetical protein
MSERLSAHSSPLCSAPFTSAFSCFSHPIPYSPHPVSRQIKTKKPMDLTQELQHLRNAEPEKLGSENAELFKNSIDGLSLSRIVDQSVKVGDRAPGFDLVNQPGQNARLIDRLRDGAVLNFLNTRIRLRLPQRHYTGVCSYFCRSLFSGLLSHVSRRNTTFLSGPASFGVGSYDHTSQRLNLRSR